MEETLDNQVQVLRKLHVDLAPEHAEPEDPIDLVDSIVSCAVDLLAKLQNTTSDASLVRTDLEQALASVKELRRELTEAQEKVSAEEESSMRLRENVSEEKARASALEAELVEGREQLRQLRKRLSDGETGSETLEKKLEEEESKVAKLTEEVASKQSHLGSIEEELRMYREKLEGLQGRSTTLTTSYEARDGRSKDLTQKVYSQNDRLHRLLDRLGYAVTRENGSMSIAKIPRAERTSQNPNDSSDPGTSIRRSITLGGRSTHDSADLDLLYWISNDATTESEKYDAFAKGIGYFDADLFAETIYLRIKEAEHKARKWQREARTYRERAHAVQKDAHDKIAFKNFKDGDLALFLPTRNQQAGAWAAFNVGFPHFFLREQDAHRLRHREWIVARIDKIQERVVDLSKPISRDAALVDGEDDNPFQLSDGLRWYLIDAHEDKPGAPATPGMGKSTVAGSNVEVHSHKVKGKSRDSVASIEGINKTLSKSLESRRSSTGSKKALPLQIGGVGLLKNSALASETNSLRAAAADSPAGTSPGEGPAASNAGSANAEAPAKVDAAGKSNENGEVRAVDSLLGP